MKYFSLDEALSKYDDYCTGYLGAEVNDSYLVGINYNVGKVRLNENACGTKLQKVIAYDRAEIRDVHMGEINMMRVSSFCGLQGAIWGLDVAPIASEKLVLPVSKDLEELDGVPIYSVEPLRDALRGLFGTVSDKKNPLLPGSHVPCAFKNHEQEGPGIICAGTAIGIPVNRDKNACLFMEEAVMVPTENLSEDNLAIVRHDHLLGLSRSVLEIGKNQGIEYEKIYVGVTAEPVTEDELACALVAHPYFKIAKDAVKKFNL